MVAVWSIVLREAMKGTNLINRNLLYTMRSDLKYFGINQASTFPYCDHIVQFLTFSAHMSSAWGSNVVLWSMLLFEAMKVAKLMLPILSQDMRSGLKSLCSNQVLQYYYWGYCCYVEPLWLMLVAWFLKIISQSILLMKAMMNETKMMLLIFW